MKRALVVFFALLAEMGATAQGSFFDVFAPPSGCSVINFETDGAGNTLNIPEGSTQDLYSDEYSSQGVLFDHDILWVNDHGADFEAAQAIGGSPQISIPGSSGTMTDLVISFSVPVKTVGLWVIDRNDKPNVPSLEARDGSGNILGTVTFAGDFVDGSVGLVDYGFLGVSCDTTIKSIRLSYDFTGFDNLTFGPETVPEPGCLALLGVGAVAMLRRRRRR